MLRRIRRHPAVADDIDEAACYIAKDSTSIAMPYLDSVEATLKWLVQRPGVGSLREYDHPRLAQVRSWHVKGFRNHLILYEIEESGIYVLAIVHGARDLPRLLSRRSI